LPDLTRLASGSSTPNLPPLYRRNAAGKQSAPQPGPPPGLPLGAANHARPLLESPDGRGGGIALLGHAREGGEDGPHGLANEVLDLSNPRRAQFLREGAVVIDKRIGRASGDERGRIVAQVGPRRAGVRVRPVLAVNEISATDEPHEGGIIDDAKRREAL